MSRSLRGGLQADDHADVAHGGNHAAVLQPNASRRAPSHTIWPYLLRVMEIKRTNRVWAMDRGYILLARGFVHLAAVIDWHSRRALAWRLSISMDTAFYTEAVEEAIAKYGKSEIFNTDLGVSSPAARSPGFCRDTALHLDGWKSFASNWSLRDSSAS